MGKEEKMCNTSHSLKTKMQENHFHYEGLGGVFFFLNYQNSKGLLYSECKLRLALIPEALFL